MKVKIKIDMAACIKVIGKFLTIYLIILKVPNGLFKKFLLEFILLMLKLTK